MESADEKKIHRVAICVCTYKRPVMLAACLRSLIDQIVPDHVDAEIVVVDNDIDGTAWSVVYRIIGTTTFPIRYTIQTRRGIASARNTAIEFAADQNFDWIAFIDDDEVADPDWLANLMATEYLDAPVLQGFQDFVYPDRIPFWTIAKPKRAKPEDEGAVRRTAVTNNVRFSADIVLAGLRFDESIGLMGGEDIDFFGRVAKAGFAIRQTNRAITRETVHPERLTYAAQVYRQYWYAASDMNMYRGLRGTRWLVTRKVHTVLTGAAFGVAELIISPFFLPFGIAMFKRRALAGGKKIGKAAGRAAGMIGIMPQPYRNVVGC